MSTDNKRRFRSGDGPEPKTEAVRHGAGSFTAAGGSVRTSPAQTEAVRHGAGSFTAAGGSVRTGPAQTEAVRHGAGSFTAAGGSVRSSPAQTEAVRHGAGPCAVVAGPGSGKTRVLTERIRFLIESRLAGPGQILVLTFSRAAAAEMRRRFLSESRGGSASGSEQEVVFGTFHAVFFRILQYSGQKKVRMIEPAAKRRYLRHLCELRPDLKTSPEELQLLISRHKNGIPCRQRWLPALVREYDQYLQAGDCLDFDDMILRCLRMLEEEKEILCLWRERFQWILVDEFQDVSPSQYAVLRLLAAPRCNLFVVGDDDQSIYGFRGADPSTMRRFLEDYKEKVHRVSLSVNYRCGQVILEAAASLIRQNHNRIEKDLRSGAPEKGLFTCRFFTGRREQYSYLAGELKELTAEAREKTAVIFRTHAAAGAFLALLREEGIPFAAEGTIQRSRSSSVEENVLRDLICYYRAAGDLDGSGARREDLMRIMNRPERCLSGSFLSADRMDRRRLLTDSVFDRGTVSELTDDLKLLASLPPAYSMRYLLDSMGYRAWAQKFHTDPVIPEHLSRNPDVPGRAQRLLNELCLEAAGFGDSTRWLFCLQEKLDRTEEEKEGQAEQSNGTGRVSVLTMHACKGLEFDTVFVPDLNEGNVPSRRALTREEIEEERRLLYVAMTRAKKTLILTCLEGTPDRPAAPSRFLQPFI